MFAAFGVFLLIVFCVSPLTGNHSLWLAFFLFLTLRGAILAARYPALRRSLYRYSTATASSSADQVN